MDQLSNWNIGGTVRGIYCGVPFVGTLTGYTRPTPDYKNTIFDILLNEKITVFGMTKESVEVWSNHKTNTCETV